MPAVHSALPSRSLPLLISSLAVAVTATGCAGLPQFLKENDDKIVAIDWT